MTYDQDFGKMDHTSPGISSGHSLANTWLSEAEAEGIDLHSKAGDPSAWYHSRPQEPGKEAECWASIWK